MIDASSDNDLSHAHMVAGALAHLARHMETGCPHSAYAAAVLLERVAADPGADAHLRAHARELADILERDDAHDGPAQAGAARAGARATPAAQPPG